MAGRLKSSRLKRQESQEFMSLGPNPLYSLLTPALSSNLLLCATMKQALSQICLHFSSQVYSRLCLRWALELVRVKEEEQPLHSCQQLLILMMTIDSTIHWSLCQLSLPYCQTSPVKAVGPESLLLVTRLLQHAISSDLTLLSNAGCSTPYVKFFSLAVNSYNPAMGA